MGIYRGRISDDDIVSEKGRQNVHSKRWANEHAKAKRMKLLDNFRKKGYN